MDKAEMGDIVLRLLEDEVMPGELRAFLTALQKSKKLRDNCSSLGTLVDPNMGEPERKEVVVALITFLLYEIDPEKDMPGSPFPDDRHWPRRMTSQMAALLHTKGTKWDNHTLRVKDAPKPVGKSYYLSLELYDIVAALEDLWGLQGVYTSRENISIMDDQLRQRGSILSKK